MNPAQIAVRVAHRRHVYGEHDADADLIEAQAAEIARLMASLEGACDLNVRIMDRLDGWQNRTEAAEAKVAALTAELELARAQLNGLPPAKPGLLRERIAEIKSEGEAL